MDEKSLQDLVMSLQDLVTSLQDLVKPLQDLVKSTGKTRILYGAEARVEGLRYQPRTQATRATFDLILTIVAKKLGDVSQFIVRSAADAALEYLKDEDLKDFEKKEEIGDLLGVSLSPKEFDELVNLAEKITDYDAEDEDTKP